MDEDNQNINLLEGMENPYPEFKEVPNTDEPKPVIDNTNLSSSGNNIIYDNQPLNDKITSKINSDDTIKLEYSKAIFSDFEKIMHYDSSSNTFEKGLENRLAYPYHYNPTLLKLIRYCNCFNCCSPIKIWCFDNICDNLICKKFLFYYDAILDITNIISFLVTFGLILFISAIIKFCKNAKLESFCAILIVYVMTLLFETRLLYYSLPQALNPEEFRKKIQAKIQTAQRIYFGDDKKVVPLVYHSYKDISGTLEMTQPFNLVKFSGRPGTYFLDGRTIREFNKLDQEFRLRGGNNKYYINYEDSPKTLNTEVNYETQTLNSMFSAHELNELSIINDELLYLAPQGFEKWNIIALICFFCLVGQVYSYLFEQKLGLKSYKIRKAIFFEEPDQEIEEKLQKYSPKIIYAENAYEFEECSGTINQNIVKPYFEKWDEYYNNENK
jgi:hypothetical protein